MRLDEKRKGIAWNELAWWFIDRPCLLGPRGAGLEPGNAIAWDRVDLEQMEWMSARINELDRRNDEQDRHRRKALADVYTLTADRDDLARRLGEATAALLALRKWVDEYSDLVERSKRWVHDSTMWETSSYPELAKEWQALWSRYPESVIDINTTPPADGSGEGA